MNIIGTFNGQLVSDSKVGSKALYRDIDKVALINLAPKVNKGTLSASFWIKIMNFDKIMSIFHYTD